MRPDRCGTGRPISSLPPGDRVHVERFVAFLSGELAWNFDTDDYAPVAEADGVRICTADQMRDRKDRT